MICKNIKFDKDFNIIVEEMYDPNYAYVYILLHKGKGETIIKDHIRKEVKFSTSEDGFYSLITLKVPRDMSNYFYYENGKFYKNILEVSIEEILETNPRLSNVCSAYDYYFLTARLRRCYINACLKIFGARCLKDENRELVYDRDLIWSSLNVIEYMADLGQYEEAQRLLEELTDCNGICLGEFTLKKCGCHDK